MLSIGSSDSYITFGGGKGLTQPRYRHASLYTTLHDLCVFAFPLKCLFFYEKVIEKLQQKHALCVQQAEQNQQKKQDLGTLPSDQHDQYKARASIAL